MLNAAVDADSIGCNAGGGAGNWMICSSCCFPWLPAAHQDSDVGGKHLLNMSSDDVWITAAVGAFQRIVGGVHIAWGLEAGACKSQHPQSLVL